MTDKASESPIGWDVAAVEAWVGGERADLAGPWVWTRLEGGHSNLTCRIDAPTGMSAVVRRPPLGELLPKAHDMSREWACLTALWPTTVPVAEPMAFCEDPDVTGAHFYVMGLIEGRTMYTREEVDDWVAEPDRATMAHSWIDTLASLHSLDPDAVGLGGLSKRTGYVERQLRTWYGSWTLSTEHAGIDERAIHAMHDHLVATVPDPGPATVVHGDYGTHNVMFSPNGRVAAVVDWEIATLGDPLADFAYAVNAWVEADDPFVDNPDFTTLAPGFPAKAELIARYADASGRDLSQLDWYVAFNRFKTACIMHGVYARYRNGQKAITEEELDELHGRVTNAIDRAVAAHHDLTAG